MKTRLMLKKYPMAKSIHQYVRFPRLNSTKVLAIMAFTYANFYFFKCFLYFFDITNWEKLSGLLSIPALLWGDWVISLFISWGLWRQFDWIWWLSLFWSCYELFSWGFIALSHHKPSLLIVEAIVLWLSFLSILLLPWARKQCSK